MSKRRRHSPEQIIEKLKGADSLLSMGQFLAHVLQKLQIAEAPTSAGEGNSAA